MDLSQISSVASLSALLGTSPGILIIILLWTLVWKGLALWKSARSNSKGWFIVLLVVNTFGLLEILYIFFLHKLGKKSNSIDRKKSRKR